MQIVDIQLSRSQSNFIEDGFTGIIISDNGRRMDWYLAGKDHNSYGKSYQYIGAAAVYYTYHLDGKLISKRGVHENKSEYIELLTYLKSLPTYEIY